MTSKKLILILAIGLLLRFGWFVYQHPEQHYDYGSFRYSAEIFYQHNVYGLEHQGKILYSAYNFPAYPVFLGILLHVVHHTDWLVICNIFLSILIVWLVYYITRTLFYNERIALIAAFICAVNPTFVFLSSLLASEHLFAVLILGIFAATISLRLFRNPHIFVYLIGILLGIALLTRGETFFYVPLIMALLYWGLPKMYRVMGASLVLCVALILPTIWVVRNAKIFNAVQIASTGGINFYYAHNPNTYGFVPRRETPLWPIHDTVASREGYKLGLDYIKDKPEHLFGNTLKGTMVLYGSSDYALEYGASSPAYENGAVISYTPQQFTGRSVYSWVTKAFFNIILMCGLAAIPLVFNRLQWVLLYGSLVANWVCYAVVFWGHPRYRFVPEIVLCILSALVVARLWQLYVQRPHQQISTKD